MALSHIQSRDYDLPNELPEFNVAAPNLHERMQTTHFHPYISI